MKNTSHHDTLLDIKALAGKALTDWEAESGGLDAYENTGTPWIEIVEQFVEVISISATGRYWKPA